MNETHFCSIRPNVDRKPFSISILFVFICLNFWKSLVIFIYSLCGHQLLNRKVEMLKSILGFEAHHHSNLLSLRKVRLLFEHPISYDSLCSITLFANRCQESLLNRLLTLRVQTLNSKFDSKSQ